MSRGSRRREAPPALEGTDIPASYVLSWNTEAESLLVDVDLLLTKEHPAYEEPRPSEKLCYRPAFLEFPWCTKVTTGDRSGPAADIVASLGAGKIDELRQTGEGAWELSGEFGRVAIHAESPMLRLKNNRA